MSEIISLKRVNRERGEDESVLPKDSAGEGGQSRKDKGTNKQMGKQGERRARKQQRKLYCKNQCGIPFCSCLPACLPVCQCMCITGLLPAWHAFKNPCEA